MAVNEKQEGGPARSTGAFPMPPKPAYSIVEATQDYAKSTGAFPMYDDRNAAERSAAHIDAAVSASYPTPGPVSYGTGDLVEQRAGLGLSADPSGLSDTDYEARPSTVPVPGADGVDREVEAKEPDGEVVGKVVERPDSAKPHGKNRATIK